MSTPGASFVTYLWHYLVSRLIYDELLRPLMPGAGAFVLIVLGCIGVGVYLLRGRVARRKR